MNEKTLLNALMDERPKLTNIIITLLRNELTKEIMIANNDVAVEITMSMKITAYKG